MKRPKAYEKKHQFACAIPKFKDESETIPAFLHINCEAINLKDAKKIKAWLEKAIKWLESQGVE